MLDDVDALLAETTSHVRCEKPKSLRMLTSTAGDT